MPYNPQIEQSIVLSKYHHRLLEALAGLPKNKRKKRPQLEYMIEQAAQEEGIIL